MSKIIEMGDRVKRDKELKESRLEGVNEKNTYSDQEGKYKLMEEENKHLKRALTNGIREKAEEFAWSRLYLLSELLKVPNLDKDNHDEIIKEILTQLEVGKFKPTKDE